MTKKSPQKTPPKVSSSPPPPKPTGGKPTPSPAVKKPTKVPPNPAASGTPTFVRPAATGETSRPTFKKGVITAEMRAAATGSAIAQDMLLALKYEGKPRHISDADYMKRFAPYGWHDDEDDAAKAVLKLWNKGQKKKGLRANDEVSLFAQIEDEFEDPCAQGGEAARIRCYQRQLAAYGVGIMDNADLNVEEMRGVVVDGLEQISPEQLAVILQGVQATGDTMAGYLSEILEREVTPDEAFRLVFGDIEFGYDDERNNVGLTVATDDPTNRENTIYILLDNGSFNENVAGGVPFGPLPASFVVVHELGHAFANRQGGNLDSDAYVAATGSFWNPTQVPLSVPMRPALATEVGLAADPAVPGNFFLPSGAYIPQGFDGGSFQEQRRNFPNEFSQFSPAEGFSDSFAQFILSPMILESLSSNRYEYFEANLTEWLETIYESR